MEIYAEKNVPPTRDKQQHANLLVLPRDLHPHLGLESLMQVP